MKSKTLKKAITLLVAMTLNILTPAMAVFAASNDELTEAVVIDDCDMTVEAYNNVPGESWDLDTSPWAINGTDDGIIYNGIEGLLKINVPANGKNRVLKFKSDIGEGTNGYLKFLVYNNVDTITSTNYNNNIQFSISAGTSDFESLCRYCTYDDVNNEYIVYLGPNTTEFYLLLCNGAGYAKSYELKEMYYEYLDTSDTEYNLGNQYAYMTGTLDNKGTFTVSNFNNSAKFIPYLLVDSIKKVVVPSDQTEVSTNLEQMYLIDEVEFESGDNIAVAGFLRTSIEKLYMDYSGNITLKSSSFFDNNKLTEIYVSAGNNLEIQDNSFKDCINLNKIYLKGQNITLESYIDDHLYYTGYPFGGTGSNTDGIDIVFGEGTETITSDSTLHFGASIKSITVPDSVTNYVKPYIDPGQTFKTKVYTDNPTVIAAYDGDDTVEIYSYAQSNIKFNEDTGHQTTITGTVQSVTTIDISIPLAGLQFRINEDREFVANPTVIYNNSTFPVDVYLANITGQTGEEPDIVPDDKYTEDEWNNLSRTATLKNLALSINEKNLTNIYNNDALDTDKMIKIGNLKSGFADQQSLEMLPSAFYGKNFTNSNELVLTYDLVIEFRIP